jgi:hypothetical protein
MSLTRSTRESSFEDALEQGPVMHDSSPGTPWVVDRPEDRLCRGDWVTGT